MAFRFLGSAAPPRPALVALAGLLLGATCGMDSGIDVAFAQARCEGTLCDLYYDHMASPQQPAPTRQAAPAAQAAPAQPSDGLLGRLFGGTPQQQTTGAPPAKRPLIGVQGGGVIGMMQGDAPKRCTGTLCDFYYGGPPPEEPAARAVPTATPADAEEPAAEEAPAPSRRIRAAAPPEERSSCAASGHDPWQCYR